MSDDPIDMAKREAQLDFAKTTVADMREKFLAAGIHPILAVYAFFHEGVAMTGIKLNDEDKLLVIDTLQTYIADTKEILAKWKN